MNRWIQIDIRRPSDLFGSKGFESGFWQLLNSNQLAAGKIIVTADNKHETRTFGIYCQIDTKDVTTVNDAMRGRLRTEVRFVEERISLTFPLADGRQVARGSCPQCGKNVTRVVSVEDEQSTSYIQLWCLAVLGSIILVAAIVGAIIDQNWNVFLLLSPIALLIFGLFYWVYHDWTKMDGPQFSIEFKDVHISKDAVYKAHHALFKL